MAAPVSGNRIECNRELLELSRQRGCPICRITQHYCRWLPLSLSLSLSLARARDPRRALSSGPFSLFEPGRISVRMLCRVKKIYRGDPKPARRCRRWRRTLLPRITKLTFAARWLYKTYSWCWKNGLLIEIGRLAGIGGLCSRDFVHSREDPVPRTRLQFSSRISVRRMRRA